VFAKGVLADCLAKESIPFVRYSTLQDVADFLSDAWQSAERPAASHVERPATGAADRPVAGKGDQPSGRGTPAAPGADPCEGRRAESA
jgi:hypothetical protein